MGALTPALRDFMEPGLAGTLALVDADGSVHMARVWAARVVDDSDVVELYVQESSARALLAALERPRRAALNFVDVRTYRSRAFKGACERAVREPDPAVEDAWREAFRAAVVTVGLPPDAPEVMRAQAGGGASVVLRLAVETVFDQSPRPGAGARL